MRIKKYVKKQYRKFSAAEGNQYIASEYALYRILKIIEKFKPKAILEVGVGIGTISDSIIKANFDFQPEVYGTEKNEFCLDHLYKNMESSYNALYLYSDIQFVPGALKADLIIIDGKEEALVSLKEKMNDKCIVIIEGDREEQVQLLATTLENYLYVHSVSIRKNKIYSNRPNDELQGGVKIFFVKPNLKEKIYWLLLKIDAKIKFELRYKVSW